MCRVMRPRARSSARATILIVAANAPMATACAAPARVATLRARPRPVTPTAARTRAAAPNVPMGSARVAPAQAARFRATRAPAASPANRTALAAPSARTATAFAQPAQAARSPVSTTTAPRSVARTPRARSPARTHRTRKVAASTAVPAPPQSAPMARPWCVIRRAPRADTPRSAHTEPPVKRIGTRNATNIPFTCLGEKRLASALSSTPRSCISS